MRHTFWFYFFLFLRFPSFILDAWLELKTRKFFDSAVPGPDLIQEDDIEVSFTVACM